MAEGDGTPSPEQRHTGVVRRSDLTRPRRSTARQDWLALVGVATLMAIVLVVVANMFGGRQVAQPSSTPSLVAVASPTLKPTYSAEPTRTPTPSPTPSPTPPPTPTPSPSPTFSPTPSPTPSPAPTASPAPLPTQPTVGLIILYPIEGSSVAERVITVRGLSQPGAQITRDVPFWLDSYATADGAGLWSMSIELNVGQNALKFRVGNDFSTTVTLNIHYAG